ncbi:MAG: ABC transporter ATP-binding protein [Odoribacter sp.]|nr:ABC transporter ATP-binding protein [Odoribacter sp.]
MQSQYVIECNNLMHYYGNKLVYENLNFKVPEGRILGLLGKNRAGKSTTINILNGFLEPVSGECLIYGENTQDLSKEVKTRIGYLIEGHIQYSFMDVHQIEKFYSGFYKKWKREAYFDLISKLKITPRQRISTMSCGQRAQVALGLILAQDPDLLILDDFSLGLDPGCRRLFIDYMREYTSSGNKTVFLTSHIIQDMERLVDDLLVMDYNRVLVQEPLQSFIERFKGFSFTAEQEGIDFKEASLFVNTENMKNHYEVYTYSSQDEVIKYLNDEGIVYNNFQEMDLTLEDAFIGLTERY